MTEISLVGKGLEMVVLLVDDRDGRVLAEVETEDDARSVLEAWARDDGSIPGYVCLVELRSRHGAILGTDTSVKVRPCQGAEASKHLRVTFPNTGPGRRALACRQI
jgi:hypothetical protein